MKTTLSLLICLLFFSCTSKHNAPSIAFRIQEKDLFPEGIAWSAKRQCFYISSIHKSKIVELNRKTNHYCNFIHPEQFGYLPGVGLWVDDERDVLWAIGSDNTARKRGSKVFLFDLHTKQLLQSYSAPSSDHHFLNDLALDKEGNAYITDTYASSIYRIQANSNRMELYHRGKEIESPNGIALSPDGSLMYIASNSHGIRILRIAEKTIVNQADTIHSTKGIDGVKYFKNGLIAVQNGNLKKPRILRIDLEESGLSLGQVEVINQSNQYMNIPTTLVLSENEAFCVANSQLLNLNQKLNQVIDTNKLEDVIILKYDLGFLK